MAGVASKDLDDHDAVVGGAGGLEVVHDVGNLVDGAVATHGVGLEVQVHGLWRVDAGDAVLRKVNDDAARVVAA